MNKKSVLCLCLFVMVLVAGCGAGRCLIDATCDDDTFCNGEEKCVGGNCQPGTPPCNDGDLCTLDCDEDQDQCLTQVCDENILSSYLHPCCCEPECHESTKDTICTFCEADFNLTRTVDGTDMELFLADLGRGPFNNPCTDQDPCNGDFNCDGDVDAADMPIFSADYGRNPFWKPCPTGSRVPWCDY